MLLVRHGESEWNRHFGATRIDVGLPDPGLTETGAEQALAAAAALLGHNVARLLSSPYRRTLATAGPIAARLGLLIGIEPIVRERCAFSCDLGSKPAELAQAWPDLDFDGLDDRWWGGRIESEQSLERRARSFYERAEVWPDRDRVAVVTHWGFIRALTGKSVGNAEIVRVAFAPR